MAMAVGVLCERIRVEEKRIMEALEAAGVLAVIVPPAAMPLPPEPTLHDIQQLFADTPGAEQAVPLVMIDRVANRAVGRIINRLLRHAGITIVDAGIASRRHRLQVASVLTVAGTPRPRTLAAFSEATAIAAANQLGYPSTMLPMLHSHAPAYLADEDTADAVIEHRVVLGSDEEEVVMMQVGALTGDTAWHRIHVAGFRAIAYEGDNAPPHEALDLAEQAAKTIDGGSTAIDVAFIEGAWVVWDVAPVADFRHATLLTEQTVQQGIATHALAKLRAREEEVRDVVLAG